MHRPPAGPGPCIPSAAASAAVAAPAAAAVVDDPDAEDVVAELGVLLVEGRVAGAPGPRGYSEGPHCAGPPGAQPPRPPQHDCDPAAFLCARARRLRQHARLLTRAGVPLSVEVLVAPDCACGAARARAEDVGALPPPPPGALLLEQWELALTATGGATAGAGSPSACPAAGAAGQAGDVGGAAGPAAYARDGPGSMTVRALLCAVRSQLHFSQLAAWLSSSGGARPRHVCYRLAVAGAAFASRFPRPPLVHAFPPAALGPAGPLLQVTVRTLPRLDSPPPLQCPLHPAPHAAPPRPPPPVSCAGPTASCAAEAASGSGCRPKARPAPAPAPATDPDPLLGDSLLDPPPRLLGVARSRPGPLPPLRPLPAVSPPAAGSSSGGVATGRAVLGTARWRDTSPPSPPNSALTDGAGPAAARSRPRGRQSLARRRDVPSCQPLQTLPTVQTPGGTGPSVSDAPALDDRMLNPCTRPGKHHCRCAYEEEGSECPVPAPGPAPAGAGSKPASKLSLELSQREVEDVLAVLRERNPGSRPPTTVATTTKSTAAAATAACCKSLAAAPPSPGPASANVAVYRCETPAPSAALLLGAILRAGPAALKEPPRAAPQTPLLARRLVQLKGLEAQADPDADPVPRPPVQPPDTTPRLQPPQHHHAPQQHSAVPSAHEAAQFRRSLRSAARMVFHCRTGLPLTSSPAPARRAHGSRRFDFDSTLSSAAGIRSALLPPSPASPGLWVGPGLEPEPDSPPASPPSPPAVAVASVAPLRGAGCWLPGAAAAPPPAAGPAPNWPRCRLSHCSSLLGSFEESVLNGRLEPVSTVHGFTADVGASGGGGLCPRHLLLPVTVFFYTLGDNDKVSTPYLGHINLGKKGYVVPRAGTIQVTLLNPLGTVVKMFVVQYDLSDMPVLATTFLRQRTLYLPAGRDPGPGLPAHRHLRYLIHLRFSSSRSGRISLHTDIRMIICRKSDLDTATAHDGGSGEELAYELRSFTHGPTNPKFSPRK